MPDPAAPRRSDPVALRSELLFRLFAFYLRLRFRRSFHAIRISGPRPVLPPEQPVILFSNHPSWWDPALYLLLADRLYRGRPGFGPMDSESLSRYGFFRRLGIFGISKGDIGKGGGGANAAGARRFLEIGRRVLAGGGPGGRAMMWVTAEGEFTDPRRRPVALRPGIAHLARAVPEALLLPLAVEYVFWNESRRELLLRFGAPIAAGRERRTAEWTRLLQDALEREMDVLAADSLSRDKARFRPLLRGSAGSSFFYDLYRRARARASGRRFTPAHEEEA